MPAIPAIEITRPDINDFDEITQLFDITIRHTFKREGIEELYPDEIEDEINSHINLLKHDFASDGHDEYYLIARLNEKIVGTICVGQPNKIIAEHLKIKRDKIPEIKSVYVFPEYQRTGVGSILFDNIIATLNKNEISEFCLDCGFKDAQEYWKNKLGEPQLVLKNFYSLNAHHMIWRKQIADI